MKKYLSLALVLLLVLSMLAGCKETFDMDKSVNKMLNKGLVVSREYKTEYQLKEAAAIFNAEIRFYGGNFIVEVVRAIALEDPKEPGLNCQFIEFATEEQAEQYATFYADARKVGNDYKVARSGKVVVLTSIESVVDDIPLDFN